MESFPPYPLSRSMKNLVKLDHVDGNARDITQTHHSHEPNNVVCIAAHGPGCWYEDDSHYRHVKLQAQGSYAIEEIGVTHAENHKKDIKSRHYRHREWHDIGIAYPYLIYPWGDENHQCYGYCKDYGKQVHAVAGTAYPKHVVSLIGIGRGAPERHTDYCEGHHRYDYVS